MDQENKYFSATVVRQLSTKQLAFHKYRKVLRKPAAVERFVKRVQEINLHEGQVMHINFYDKKTGQFSHRVTVKKQ